MVENERRRRLQPIRAGLRYELNDVQREMLADLEKFGWELKFIRHPESGDPIAVVFDGDRKKFAILEADGTLNENPWFKIRK